IDVARVQFTMQDFRPCGHDMKNHARIALRYPIDDGRDEAVITNQRIPDLHLPGRWVGEKLDGLHALAQAIEYGHSAIEQRAAVFVRFDPFAVAIEQAYAERIL